MSSRRPRRHASGFLRNHSLSLIVSAILVVLVLLYTRADPSTHAGAFFGNAIADWLGMLVFVVATKYFFEVGSKESRQPPRHLHMRVARFLVRHSLTLVLVVTGAGWVAVFARSGVDAKWGAVTGNIVSEWTQILGLVLITKYAKETGSKDS
jgi:hypothetical protein